MATFILNSLLTTTRLSNEKEIKLYQDVNLDLYTSILGGKIEIDTFSGGLN